MSFENKRSDEYAKLIEIEKQVTRLCDTMDRIEVLIQKHDSTLFGNSHAGMTTRIDRLEQHKIHSDRNVFVAWTAFVGLILKTAWDTFLNK